MRFLLALLIIIALAAPNAQAVVDPDPDGIGVYFDLNADITETVAMPSLPFDAYVILTNPTSAEIYGISFSFNINVPPESEAFLFRLSYDVVFGCIAPHLDFHPFYGDVWCGGTEPIPGSPAVVLLRWQFMLLAPVSAEFYLGQSNRPDPLPSAYQSEAGWVPMHVSSGDPALPVAMINGTGVVSTEATTFGRLKALYR